MYATLDLIENSKHSGKLIGVHQKLDKAARQLLAKNLGREIGYFPTIDEILYFEGSRGPDGLKRKSPGVDDPDYFIDPKHDDGVLFTSIKNHQYNLAEAIKTQNKERAAFEAAWMAHAIVDGLTPAHHYPFRKIVDELMTDKDYKTLFGREIKGIMRGENLAQAARNNWLYWGAGVDVDSLALAPEAEPADFDEFWARQFARLDKVPIRDDRVEIDSRGPNVRLYAVRIDCAGLRPVTGYLSVPKAVDDGKTFPCHLMTHGYNGDRCNHVRPDQSPSDRILLNINAHGLKLAEFGATDADTKALRWEVRSNGQIYAFDPEQNKDPETAYSTEWCSASSGPCST